MVHPGCPTAGCQVRLHLHFTSLWVPAVCPGPRGGPPAPKQHGRSSQTGQGTNYSHLPWWCPQGCCSRVGFSLVTREGSHAPLQWTLQPGDTRVPSATQLWVPLTPQHDQRYSVGTRGSSPRTQKPPTAALLEAPPGPTRAPAEPRGPGGSTRPGGTARAGRGRGDTLAMAPRDGGHGWLCQHPSARAPRTAENAPLGFSFQSYRWKTGRWEPQGRREKSLGV